MHFLRFLPTFFFFIFLCNPIYSIEINEETSRIIYVKGSCSSGKSTFIRALLNQQKDIEVIDEDSIMQRSYVDAVEARFPDKFFLIRQAILSQNLYHAIREKDVLFKKTTSEEDCKKVLEILSTIQEELNRPENSSWKQEVSHSIDLEVLKRIEQAIEQQKIILLDSWYIKPKHLKLHFPETVVIQVLLYCPLKEAYERFTKRNEDALIKGDLSEKRYLRQLIGSFISLYEVNIESEKAIEEISKLEMESVFAAMASPLKNGPDFYQKPIFTFEELSKPFFLKLQAGFLLPMEERSKADTVFYISPKEKYDIILDNTSNNQEHIYKEMNSKIGF